MWYRGNNRMMCICKISLCFSAIVKVEFLQFLLFFLALLLLLQRNMRGKIHKENPLHYFFASTQYFFAKLPSSSHAICELQVVVCNAFLSVNCELQLINCLTWGGRRCSPSELLTQQVYHHKDIICPSIFSWISEGFTYEAWSAIPNKISIKISILFQWGKDFSLVPMLG